MLTLDQRCVKYVLVIVVSIFALSISGAAYADAKSCVTTHATGQREARAGHLRLATQLFTQCGSDESCPSQLRQECAEFLQSVQQTVPTVIFSVLDEKGGDISAVKVFSTDELIIDGLDGRAIQIDPGKHRLRFLLPWGAVLSSDVLIREGEKNRIIQVKMAGEAEAGEIVAKEAKTTAAQPLPPAEGGTPSPSTVSRRSPPAAAWVLVGTSLVGLGVGTTFALVGHSRKSDIDACSPNCSNDVRPTYDALKRDYLVADIGFAVGVVSAGFATWLFVAPPTRKSSADTVAQSTVRSLRPVAVAWPGGGALGLSGGF